MGRKENNREVSLYNNCSVTACAVSHIGLEAMRRCCANRALPRRTFAGHTCFTRAQNWTVLTFFFFLTRIAQNFCKDIFVGIEMIKFPHCIMPGNLIVSSATFHRPPLPQKSQPPPPPLPSSLPWKMGSQLELRKECQFPSLFLPTKTFMSFNFTCVFYHEFGETPCWPWARYLSREQGMVPGDGDPGLQGC